jgi:hypothetical protein
MPIAIPTEGATARVFTFKEGLLSGVAHDLELAFDRFRIDWTSQHVSAVFDSTSLRVLHAVVSGRPAPDALTARDRRKIERNIADDVLMTSRHPEARFESSTIAPEGDGFVVHGTLTLAGRRQELSLHVRRDETSYTAELVLDQRDFGITPFSAMMGALKLKPEVRVRVAVPAA